ncbi:MAG: hypothetical protein Cons2KO_00540 [Congregibacter sp.]
MRPLTLRQTLTRTTGHYLVQMLKDTHNPSADLYRVLTWIESADVNRARFYATRVLLWLTSTT